MVHHPRLQKATELFADERFDGIPEKVMDTTPEDIADPDSDFEEQFDEHEEEAEDDITGADEDPRRIPSPPQTMSVAAGRR